MKCDVLIGFKEGRTPAHIEGADICEVDESILMVERGKETWFYPFNENITSVYVREHD